MSILLWQTNNRLQRYKYQNTVVLAERWTEGNRKSKNEIYKYIQVYICVCAYSVYVHVCVPKLSVIFHSSLC